MVTFKSLPWLMKFLFSKCQLLMISFTVSILSFFRVSKLQFPKNNCKSCDMITLIRYRNDTWVSYCGITSSGASNELCFAKFVIFMASHFICWRWEVKHFKTGNKCRRHFLCGFEALNHSVTEWKRGGGGWWEWNLKYHASVDNEGILVVSSSP